MNSDELYQAVLMQHSRHPKNFGPLDQATHRAEGYNALCGDEVTVEMRLCDGVVEAVGFQASACAICTASASIMTCEAMGLPKSEVIDLATGFRALATNGTVDDSIRNRPVMDVMGTIHQFPPRVKCATLPWETMISALKTEIDFTASAREK